MRRPNRTQAELRIPDGVGDIVTANRGLIGRTFTIYFPWLTSQFAQLREDLEAVAMFSLAKAARDVDANKGRYSTVAMTYIRNDIINELAKYKRKAGRFVNVTSDEMHEHVEGRIAVDDGTLTTEEQAEEERQYKIRRGLKMMERRRRYSLSEAERMQLPLFDFTMFDGATSDEPNP